MIEVRDLTFGYERDKTVLSHVGFSAARGEILNILGPNGSGKSTLLKILLGFLAVRSGSVRIDGMDIDRLSKRQLAGYLAYVPQQHHGAFQYTALDVVLMGRTSSSPWYTIQSEDYDKAREAMDTVRISRHAATSYLCLSGGERQMVLIARALAQGAEFCIMDEPVTGLDYGNQFHLLECVRELAGKGLSFILTTHHPEHAVFLGGRALLFQDGHLLADGKAEEVITASSICGLYNLPSELLRRIVEF